MLLNCSRHSYKYCLVYALDRTTLKVKKVKVYLHTLSVSPKSLCCLYPLGLWIRYCVDGFSGTLERKSYIGGGGGLLLLVSKLHHQ